MKLGSRSNQEAKEPLRRLMQHIQTTHFYIKNLTCKIFSKPLGNPVCCILIPRYPLPTTIDFKNVAASGAHDANLKGQLLCTTD